MAVLKDMHLTIDKGPNTTALALVGHSLIRVRWQVKASNAWNTKYGVPHIWALAALGPNSGDSDDVSIKKEFAVRHPWDEREANTMVDLLLKV